MSIEITVGFKGARADTVRQLVEQALADKYPGASITVTRKEPAESRADRFSEAQSLIEDGKSIAEELRDEIQEWHDNLPENFQQGEKGEACESCVSQLEEFIDACDTATGTDVEFPGMY